MGALSAGVSADGRGCRVTASDGVELHAEVDDAPDARVTVVFSHGWTLSSETWRPQRDALRGGARVVAWDQRGHGRSARGARDSATIEQVGRDLLAVLDHTTPQGPVVLAGHSMGAMAVMALAGQRPDFVAARVQGVALVSTAAGGLRGSGLGLSPAAIMSRLAPRVLEAAGGRPAVAERLRRSRWSGADRLVRRALFGPEAPRPVVERGLGLVRATPVEVVADFFPTLRAHDTYAALAGLRDLPAVILVGELDRLTPIRHSQAIARALPRAELVVARRAGHCLPLECPGLVTERIRDLADRAS
ncbi:MAG: alpha/beta fold hydrolase [Carbonactinosporaceae bacterium]